MNSKEKVYKLLGGLKDNEFDKVYKILEPLEDPLQDSINEIIRITKISKDLSSIIKKYLEDKGLEEFVEHAFRGRYNPYKFKEKFLEKLSDQIYLGEETLKSPVYSVLLDFIDLPSFTRSHGEEIYEKFDRSIENNENVLKFYNIVKEWPEVMEMAEKENLKIE